MKKILSLILTACVAISFGCGKRETIQTPDGKMTVEQKGDTAKVEIATAEGKATMTANDKGVAIPDTFPKDLPLPKGAVPKMAMSQGKAEMLHLQVPGTVAEVDKAYQEKLKGEGWEIGTTMNLGDSTMIEAKKTDRKCAVMVMKDPAGTMVQLTVNQD